MILNGLTDVAAVHKAAEECLQVGTAEFLARYGYGGSTRYWVVVDGRLFDAKAIAGVAYGHQHPRHGPLTNDQFSGGEAGANQALRRLGFGIVSRKPATADDERDWRTAVGQHLDAVKTPDGYLTAEVVREWGAYGGAQGVWVDAVRTSAIAASGVAVGVLHTGIRYADDLSDDGILYHYPQTNRAPSRDDGEIRAMKNAADLRLQVFVISRPTPSSRWRQARLAWIEGWDDDAKIFSMTFAAQPPAKVQTYDDSDEQPFTMFGNTSL